MQDDEFAEVREFLAERRLRPDDEPGILAALRDRRWDLELTGTPGDWNVRVKPREIAAYPFDPGLQDSDRQRTLFRGIRLTFAWLTPTEARELFDRDTTSMLGMSAGEFTRRLDAGELDMDDPRVRHLSTLRPATL